jgi:UDP-2-acetamido-3-amino-2,3-dideoxy-glucuronate N-acetyltransferase
MRNAPFIHPTAIVDTGSTIGNGTKIWHFSHIMPGANIGENCNIGQNVYIDNNTSIGNNVKIQNNVSVYSNVNIEDDCFLGPSMVFTNVINPRAFIERKNEFKSTLIQKGATIGANATIICGITLGKYCMIGAGAVVTKNVNDFALMVGNPATQIGWVSKNGHRLHFTKETNHIELKHEKLNKEETNQSDTFIIHSNTTTIDNNSPLQNAVCPETKEKYVLLNGKVELKFK